MGNGLSWRDRFQEKLRILLLTVCLLGLQLAWSVELAFGTPFLKSVGVSTAVTAMVWLAGPISGLIMQPIVGAYSDACTSRFGRRRPFMVAGTILSVFSFVMVGWSPEISGWFSSDKGTVNTLTQFFAVIGFYMLDFSINAVQAACRALIVDAAGTQHQEVANAWASRMLGMGGVGGYFVGTLPLKETFGGYLGNTQMQVLCVFGSLSLCLFVGMTCWANPEKPIQCPSVRERKNPFHALLSLQSSFKNIPPAAQRLFNVQFFAWIGWMPFLFYSSQWVAESYRRQYPDSLASSILVDDATGGPDARAGSLAMLLFSLVCLFSSFVMPVLIVPRGKASQRQTDNHPSWWKRFPDELTLPRVYTASHLLFACCMLLTPLGFDCLVVATLLPTIAGLSYAVTTYVPFVVLAECVEGNKSMKMTRRFSDSTSNLVEEEGKETEYQPVPKQDEGSIPKPTCRGQDVKVRSSSQLTLCVAAEGNPIQEIYETDDKMCQSTSVLMEMLDSDDEDESRAKFDEVQEIPGEDRRAVDGGTILGIHNCYVVAPQFLTSILAFVIFLALDDGVNVIEGGPKPLSDKDGIGWVLRLGGVSALVAAYLSLQIQ